MLYKCIGNNEIVRDVGSSYMASRNDYDTQNVSYMLCLNDFDMYI